MKDQIPAWVDALYQGALESFVAANGGSPDEQRNAEGRARFVAERLDEVAAALERAHLAEDGDERRDHIFAAHKALVGAETVFS